MLIADLTKQAKEIERLTDCLREQIFRVVPLASDFYLVLYLSDDLKSIETNTLNSLFLPATLEDLTNESLLVYAQLKIKIDSIATDGQLTIDGCEKTKGKLLTYLRSQRKGISDFGIVDPSGKLL